MTAVPVDNSNFFPDIRLASITQPEIYPVHKKTSGLLIPAFALRRSGDLGIGDTKAVKEAIEFCSKLGIGLLELLPINETGGDNSPYGPISIFALEPALLTIEPGQIPGLDADTFLHVVNQYDLTGVSQEKINYPAVKSLKNELLYSAYNNFYETDLKNDSVLAREFKKFEAENSHWLDDYSLFRELMNLHNDNPCWDTWGNEELCTPHTARRWLERQPDKAEIEYKIQFYKYVQWIADKQWADVSQFAKENSVRLMGDIPYGINRYSADVWARPDLFDTSWSIGAPAEKTFKGSPLIERFGQIWGGPLYIWEAHELEDFAWWRARVQQVCKYFDEFRIDHVLGFFRVYAFKNIEGGYERFLSMSDEEIYEEVGTLACFVPFPDDNEFNMQFNMHHGRKILSVIKEAAGDTEIIAEDLGANVPKYVGMVLAELGISGYSLFPVFKKYDSQEFMTADEIPELSLATFGTHDHLPLKKFYAELVETWHGPDGHDAWLEVQRLMRAIGWDDNNPPTEFNQHMHARLLSLLMNSASRKIVINFPDLIGSEKRWNDPAKGADGNWTERIERSLKLISEDQSLQDTFGLIRILLEESGRIVADQHPDK